MNAPVIKNIENINVPECRHYDLSGIPCYVIGGGTQAIVKMQLTFPAGRKYETKSAQARMTNMLLKEGCADYDAESFALQVDNYGFSLKVSSDLDHAFVTLICLKQFFKKGYDLVKSMLESPTFEEKDIEKFAKIASQNLKSQLQKNELVCYRSFTERLFGPKHIYGYNTDPESYFEITRDDLVTFHREHYDFSKMKVFLSGQITPDILEMLDFGTGKSMPAFAYQTAEILEGESVFIEGKQQFQSAIKTGVRLFPRSHPDYCDMFILNTILGGYFGSRLMRNIREDKGYSYNIYSIIDTMSHDGYLSINCEVSNEYRRKTIDEIHKELEILTKELIPEDEMRMVRNYMLGQVMHSLDGPLASSELFSSLIANGLDEQFLHKMIDRTKFITTFELRSKALKYLQVEAFNTVIVGKAN